MLQAEETENAKILKEGQVCSKEATVAGMGPMRRSKMTRDKMKRLVGAVAWGALWEMPRMLLAFILSEIEDVEVRRFPTANAELEGCISDSGT